MLQDHEILTVPNIFKPNFNIFIVQIFSCCCSFLKYEFNLQMYFIQYFEIQNICVFILNNGACCIFSSSRAEKL